MKQLTIVLTAVLLLVAAALAEERATVFRGLAWGDPPEALGDYVLVEKDDLRKMAAYRRIDETKHLGLMTVEEINYMFFDNRLVGIQVKATDYSVVRDSLIARYGKPNSDSPLKGTVWRMGDTIIGLDPKPIIGNEVTFILFQDSGMKEAQAYYQEQLKKETQSAW